MADDLLVDGVPCMLMRGGTSKGALFLQQDLPLDPTERNNLLLRIMGSPDPRQIDGIGGAHPLTSKVGIISPSSGGNADVDFLFLQVSVTEEEVSDAQTCGNILAAVGPFAIERGLVNPPDGPVNVTINLLNTGEIAVASFQVDNSRVVYSGHTRISGVPGSAAPINLQTMTPPGKSVLPTGNVVEEIGSHTATLVDAGMPCVLLKAEDFGLTGHESVEDLESNSALTDQIEKIRLAAGKRFSLGDVGEQTVPKMFLLSSPRNGGTVCTRGFIPHRVHTSIGVLMAASITAAVHIPGTLAHDIAQQQPGGEVVIEHPSGTFSADVEVTQRQDGSWAATTRTVRTARKLFDGRVFPRPFRDQRLSERTM